MRPILIIVSCLLLLFITAGCGSPAGVKPIPLPSPTLIPPPVLTPESRLITLSFDDAFYNQYEVALPVLVKYGFRASFGVITDYIGKGHSLMEYMGEDELRELAAWGMDIASHTKNHPDLTGDLSDGQLRSEIIDSKLDLENMGFSVSTMLYPYYKYNDKVIEYVREAGYVCARAGWSKEMVLDITTDEPDAKYHINAWQISDQDMDTFKIIVGRASRNSVVSLVYHLIAYEGPETTSTDVANFYKQMAYLERNGFTVVLLPELFQP
jgi:peptidoglycan/xylan/chitin deacetylase (PgdA/CDA1 family)